MRAARGGGVVHIADSAPAGGPVAVATEQKAAGGEAAPKSRRRAALEAKREDVARSAELARTAHGFSERQCADRAGVSRARWCEVESGRVAVDAALLEAASTTLAQTFYALRLGALRPQASGHAEDSLSEACRLLGRMGAVLADHKITDEERPEAVKIGQALVELGQAWLRAGQGE